MIFKTVNSSINKASYDINIKNIDLAAHHWGSEKYIAAYLDEVETLFLNKETFDKKIVLHAISLMKANHRVQDAKFYRVPEENKLILLITSAVGKMKDFEMFSREMAITLKREKFSFSIIEILEKEAEEIKTGTKSVPANWVIEERLTDKLNKLKAYA